MDDLFFFFNIGAPTFRALPYFMLDTRITSHNITNLPRLPSLNPEKVDLLFIFYFYYLEYTRTYKLLSQLPLETGDAQSSLAHLHLSFKYAKLFNRAPAQRCSLNSQERCLI